MTLLARVVELLREERIECVVIGAAALAAHGVGRSTLDIDLLVTDQRVLELQADTLERVGGIVTRGDGECSRGSGTVKLGGGKNSSQIDISPR